MLYIGVLISWYHSLTELRFSHNWNLSIHLTAFCSPKIYLCFKKRRHLWREVQSKSIGVSKISKTVFTSNLCYNLTKIFSEYIAQSRPGAWIAWLGGGTERNFGGTRSLFEYGSSEKGEDQRMKKRSSSRNFHKFWLSSQNSCDFSRNRKWRPKKRSSSQNWNEIQRKFTKITKTQFLLTKSRAVNTNLGNLGLDLHSSSLELLISLGHSPRSGGTSSHLGGTAPECPPVAPGLAQSNSIVLWDFTNSFVCVIFIVVCVLIRITNKNQRRSIKVLKMKKKMNATLCTLGFDSWSS